MAKFKFSVRANYSEDQYQKSNPIYDSDGHLVGYNRIKKYEIDPEMFTDKIYTRSFEGKFSVINSDRIKCSCNIINKNINLPLIGTIYDNNNNPAKDASVIFKYLNGKIVDRCITNENGEYKAFIDFGIYDIEIIFKSGKKHVVKNQVLNNPINKIKEFSGYGSFKITDYIEDDVNNRINDAYILVTSYNEILNIDELVCCVKTGDLGYYSFNINKGNYNIQIRHKDYDTKFINNLFFNSNIDEFKKALKIY